MLVTSVLNNQNFHISTRLEKRRSILILTEPAIKTGFNRLLLEDCWSNEVVDLLK